MTPADLPIPVPNIFHPAQSPQEVAATVQAVLLVGLVAMAPALLMMTTAFTRIVVVFGFLRRALATQQVPPDQVMTGMALFLTFMVMAPTWKAVYDDAVVPYLRKEEPIARDQAVANAAKPVKAFMFKQLARNEYKDLFLFLDLSKRSPQRFKSPDEVPFSVLAPAFLLGELKTAFQMGFLLYLPFLVIDLVVSSVLLSMGMMMLPPVMVSLPFKLLLFVLADGWRLVVGGLVQSFSV